MHEDEYQHFDDHILRDRSLKKRKVIRLRPKRGIVKFSSDTARSKTEMWRDVTPSRTAGQISELF
jgi:hypothetical protein